MVVQLARMEMNGTLACLHGGSKTATATWTAKMSKRSLLLLENVGLMTAKERLLLEFEIMLHGL